MPCCLLVRDARFRPTSAADMSRTAKPALTLAFCTSTGPIRVGRARHQRTARFLSAAAPGNPLVQIDFIGFARPNTHVRAARLADVPPVRACRPWHSHALDGFRPRHPRISSAPLFPVIRSSTTIVAPQLTPSCWATDRVVRTSFRPGLHLGHQQLRPWERVGQGVANRITPELSDDLPPRTTLDPALIDWSRANRRDDRNTRSRVEG